jgi:hypothetical protein
MRPGQLQPGIGVSFQKFEDQEEIKGIKKGLLLLTIISVLFTGTRVNTPRH